MPSQTMTPSSELFNDNLSSIDKLPILSPRSDFVAGEEILLLPLPMLGELNIEHETLKDNVNFSEYLSQVCQKSTEEPCRAITVYDNNGDLLDAFIESNGERNFLDRDVLMICADVWDIPTIPIIHRGRYNFNFIASLRSRSIILPLHERVVDGHRVIARTQ